VTRDPAGRTVLVVGGAGFVGSALVRELLGGGVSDVVVVDNLLSSERENLPDDERVTLVEGSINDPEVLAGLDARISWAFQLATYHGNQSSMADPLADHEHNTLVTLSLLERMRELGSADAIVYAGAGCTVAEKTFDGAAATVESDTVSLWLDSPYQVSKIVGEYYCNYYFSRHGLPAVRARFQNVYGPGEVLGAGRWRGTVSTVWRNVTPTFVYRALKGEALPVENGGVATRDLIHVEDMARGLVACAERGRGGEAYNLASGVETSILELAETINELAGNDEPIALTPARDWDHSGQRYGSPEKARQELGFEARIGLREGLESTIAWTRENLEWIEACMARHADEMAAAGAPPAVSTST
jgi:nucleoside-diphosphate-sugar epimerase